MNAAGIDVLGYFITGAPTETPAYRKSLAGKIRELGIKYPYFNILMALPNTAYYDDLLRNGTSRLRLLGEYVENPHTDFVLPFPFGEARHRENEAFVTELINEFKN